MTLPASGQISLSQVNTELGLSSTALIAMGDAAVRGLFEVPSGQIAMSNGYGKANVFSFAISTNQTDANLRTLATTAGWNGTAPVQATINSGVVISGTVQGNSTAALTVDGSWPGGVTLTNNGSIIGRGGNGGAGGFAFSPFTLGAAGSGSTGGRALSASVALTLDNTSGTIAGGGGGGAGGQCAGADQDPNGGFHGAGGGGGGGRSSNTNSSGGGGGGTGSNSQPLIYDGGSGGTGTISAAGSGGIGGRRGYASAYINGASGGSGGAYGTGGSGGGSASTVGPGFAPSIRLGPAGSAGGAGQAISGNSNITYVATGTRIGPIV